jgi:hypothetical protein
MNWVSRKTTLRRIILKANVTNRLTVTSMTDAAIARDSDQTTPRRARHAKR